MPELKFASEREALSSFELAHDAGIIVFQYKQTRDEGQFTKAFNDYVHEKQDTKPYTNFARVKNEYLEYQQNFQTTRLHAYDKRAQTKLSIRLHPSHTVTDFNLAMDFLRVTLEVGIKIQNEKAKKEFYEKMAVKHPWTIPG